MHEDTTTTITASNESGVVLSGARRFSDTSAERRCPDDNNTVSSATSRDIRKRLLTGAGPVHSVSFSSALSASFSEVSAKQQAVVILCSKLNKSIKARNAINIARGLIEYGFETALISLEIDEKYWATDLARIVYSQFQTSIPNDICGCGKKFFSAIKFSWLAWKIRFRMTKKYQPIVIVCDEMSPVIWYLKKLRVEHVIYFQSSSGLTKVSPAVMNQLSYADLLLVENNKTCNQFFSKTEAIKLPATEILYPCVDMGEIAEEETSCISLTKIIKRSPRIGSIIFAYGAYDSDSNFEIIIEAYLLFLMYRFQHVDVVQEGIPLVIAGQLNYDDINQVAYFNDLIKQAYRKSIFKPNIVFLDKLSTLKKKTLLSHSIAVCHASSNDIYGTQILEAMYMGRVIIANSHGIATEYLDFEEGILTLPDATNFAKAMLSVLLDKEKMQKYGENARKHFFAKYSFRHYHIDIGTLIQQQYLSRQFISISTLVK